MPNFPKYNKLNRCLENRNFIVEKDKTYEDLLVLDYYNVCT